MRGRRWGIFGTLGAAGAAAITSIILATGNAAQTAHLWIATTGNDTTCTRNASLVDYSTAVANGNVCATGPKAYQLASLGDTVYVKGGTYTTTWTFSTTKTATAGTCNYNYGGASDLSNCVTFKAASGETPTFAVGGTQTEDIHVCADFLAFDGLTFTDTTYTEASTGDTLSNAAFGIGKGDSSCRPGSDSPHDIYLHNLTVGLVNIGGGSYNVWVVGGTSTGSHDLGWNFGGSCTPCTDALHNSGIVGMTFIDSGYQNHDYPTHHMTVIHTTGATPSVPNHDLTFAGNRFEGACSVNACPEELEVETSLTNSTFENNYFDGTAVFDIVCNSSNGCVTSGNTIRFNTFANGSAFQGRQGCLSSCTGTITGSVYGNINPTCPTTITLPAGSAGYAYSYNVESATQSGQCAGSTGSVYSTTTSFVSAGSPNYNDALAASQTAAGFVPNSVTWPATNIDGTIRSGATTDAGAS